MLRRVMPVDRGSRVADRGSRVAGRGFAHGRVRVAGRVAARALSPFSWPFHHFPCRISGQKPQLLTSTGERARKVVKGPPGRGPRAGPPGRGPSVAGSPGAPPADPRSRAGRPPAGQGSICRGPPPVFTVIDRVAVGLVATVTDC